MEEVSCDFVKIERPSYDQEQLQRAYEYENSQSTGFIKEFFGGCSKCSPSKVLKKTVPIFDWLPKYKWKEDFSSDLVSGITVAIMHIPQGMAYALLGNVPPILGIYTAFFPVLIYSLFGTSRHNSMGTFAVVCLLTGNVVLKHANINNTQTMGASPSTVEETVTTTHVGEIYSPVQIATILGLIVSVYQLIMFIFRLGILSSLLSETLVSGFTTGASFCVLISQIKDLLGLSIPSHAGYFVNVKIFISIFERITQTNYIACLISAATIIIMCVNNEIVKPKWSKKFTVPIPIELIVVMAGTLISKYCHLREDFAIKSVGSIPSGLPAPQLPPVNLFSSLLLDGFTIAIVSYTITLSMALIFAQKMQYEVDANQELLAMSLGNGFGSFFSCMPFCASLSRSMIQQTVGGKTQLTSLISCGILVFILLWIGPFFEPLPKSVLASIIVVALKGMLIQVTAFKTFYKLSKLDATVWMVTFLTVIFIGIDIGLFVGIGLSLLTIFIMGFKPYVCLLGNIPRTDLYLDTMKYKAAKEIPGIKIFHYQGGINFATKSHFKSQLCNLINIDPQKELITRCKLKKLEETRLIRGGIKDETKFALRFEKLKKRVNFDVKCIIFDFSALSYIDPSGASHLRLIAEDFRKINVPIYIAGSSQPVYELLDKCGLIKDKLFRYYPTVHDAIMSANTIFFNYQTDHTTLALNTISRL